MIRFDFCLAQCQNVLAKWLVNAMMLQLTLLTFPQAEAPNISCGQKNKMM